MGVVVWPMIELEADDALASAAHLASKDKKVEKVAIWTPDKDLAQCVRGTRVVQIDGRQVRVAGPESVQRDKARGCWLDKVPRHVLGTKPGEVVVLRNIGGRITPGLLEQLGLLGRIGEVAGEIAGGGGEFHIIVLQHTDCGMTRLAGDPAMLAHYFQIPEGELKKKSVTDPRAAVALDVAALRAISALPDAWLISGVVYDVATGLVEIVVPPAPIRTA